MLARLKWSDKRFLNSIIRKAKKVDNIAQLSLVTGILEYTLYWGLRHHAPELHKALKTGTRWGTTERIEGLRVIADSCEDIKELAEKLGVAKPRAATIIREHLPHMAYRLIDTFTPAKLSHISGLLCRPDMQQKYVAYLMGRSSTSINNIKAKKERLGVPLTNHELYALKCIDPSFYNSNRAKIFFKNYLKPSKR